MEILEETESGVVVLRLAGRLDGVSSPALEQVIDGVFERGERSLVIDLEEVPYISSRGLRVFLVCAKKVASHDGQFAVCALQKFVRDVFEMTGFLKILAVSTTRADAIASLSRPDAESR